MTNNQLDKLSYATFLFTKPQFKCAYFQKKAAFEVLKKILNFTNSKNGWNRGSNW